MNASSSGTCFTGIVNQSYGTTFKDVELKLTVTIENTFCLVDYVNE